MNDDELVEKMCEAGAKYFDLNWANTAKHLKMHERNVMRAALAVVREHEAARWMEVPDWDKLPTKKCPYCDHLIKMGDFGPVEYHDCKNGTVIK